MRDLNAAFAEPPSFCDNFDKDKDECDGKYGI